MIDYVDKLLKHWAQEMSVTHTTAGLGVRSAWVDMGKNVGSCDLVRSKAHGRYTATGVATRPSRLRGGVGKVAERLDRAVEALPEHLKLVVEVQYRHNFNTPREKALFLKCSVKIFYKHIHRAHELISVDLPDSYANWSLSYPPCG